MKPSSDREKQSALSALLQRAGQYSPRANQLRAVAHSPAQASPGEVWLTQTPATANGEPDEPLTVLLIERFEGADGEPTIVTGAPIFGSPRMAGPTDAILPRVILGFEGGIAFGCSGSILTQNLAACEGALPEDWTSRLVAFYAYVRGVTAKPPAGVTTGASYIDKNDPAFSFHEDLAEQMQALAIPALESATAEETDKAPRWFEELVSTIRDVTRTVSDLWEQVAFPIPLPAPGLGLGAVRGLGSSILGVVGVGAVIGARWLFSGRAPSDRWPLCQLAVGETGATVLLQQCATPEGTFVLDVLRDPENRLQGSEVLDAAGHVVATISGGKSDRPFAPVEGNVLLLRLSDGTFAPLKEVASPTKFPARNEDTQGNQGAATTPDEFVDAGATQEAFNVVPDEPLALAASELRKRERVDDLLPGFSGEAWGDDCEPSKVSTVSLAVPGAESPRPADVPAAVIVKWPAGQTKPQNFTHDSGWWFVEIQLPLPWPKTVSLLREKKISIEPVPLQ